MDTTEAAARLGTTPRTLRQFLRHPSSTFIAVGSGSRYDFDEADIPTLTKRFADWRSGNKTTPKKKSPKTGPITPKTNPAAAIRKRAPKPSKKDEKVWQEEGSVVIADIRQPRVRARVLADARAAEDRLMMLLMSRGLHVSQLGDAPRKATA